MISLYTVPDVLSSNIESHDVITCIEFGVGVVHGLMLAKHSMDNCARAIAERQEWDKEHRQNAAGD